jgi:hypothetical protein
MILSGDMQELSTKHMPPCVVCDLCLQMPLCVAGILFP